MRQRRLLAQSAAVLGLGVFSLLSPPAVEAADDATACGVCWSEDCPSSAVQHSWCGSICGAGSVSEGCPSGLDGCEHVEDARNAWWCE